MQSDCTGKGKGRQAPAVLFLKSVSWDSCRTSKLAIKQAIEDYWSWLLYKDSDRFLSAITLQILSKDLQLC